MRGPFFFHFSSFFLTFFHSFVIFSFYFFIFSLNFIFHIFIFSFFLFFFHFFLSFFHFSSFSFISFILTFSFFHFFIFSSPGPLPQASQKNIVFYYENLDFKARIWVREERKKERKRKKNAPTETGPLPRWHVQDLCVIRVRGNPSLQLHALISATPPLISPT